MAFFSIIVPVYKVEAYLPQCVASILSQTFTDYELLLIDDGSPDRCGILCDQYACNDSRIRVLHKDNGGLSSARNSGLRMATGDFIVFLDSDDYWDDVQALSMIYKEFMDTGADVVLFKHRKLDMDTGIFSQCSDTTSTENIVDFPYPQQLEYCVSRQLFDTCAWNKAFRRSLTDKHDLFFTEGIIAEDLDWAARLSIAADGLAIVPTPIHVYRKGRPGAITTSLKLKNLVDTKGSIERCLTYVKVLHKDKLFLSGYYGYVAFRYVIWMAESAVVSSPEKKTLVHEMKRYRWLLKYGSNQKVRLAAILNKLLGYHITRWLLGLYLRQK